MKILKRGLGDYYELETGSQTKEGSPASLILLGGDMRPGRQPHGSEAVGLRNQQGCQGYGAACFEEADARDLFLSKAEMVCAPFSEWTEHEEAQTQNVNFQEGKDQGRLPQILGSEVPDSSTLGKSFQYIPGQPQSLLKQTAAPQRMSFLQALLSQASG